MKVPENSPKIPMTPAKNVRVFVTSLTSPRYSVTVIRAAEKKVAKS
jgi:hypothetical protein